MRRESLKMQEQDWQRLEDLTAATGSEYSGKPSWRRLMLRITRGEITLRVRKHNLAVELLTEQQLKRAQAASDLANS